MRREIKPLTGLRGVGAMLVMLYHYGQPFESHGINSHFHIRHGYLAVDCFYILSGFVLAYSYGEWFSGHFELALFRDFLIRRVARLYPAYLVIMFLVLLKTMINLSGNGALNNYTAYDYVLNTLMLTGVGLDVYPVIADAWSVSAEMVAYLFFPILVFAAVFSRPIVGAAVLFFASTGLLLVAHSGLGVRGSLDVVNGNSTYPVLRCICEFTIGVFLVRLSNLLTPLLKASELLFGLSFLTFVLAWLLNAPDLLIVACMAGLIFTLSFDGNLANQLFANKPIFYLGRISYSLYLIHPTFISVSIYLALFFQNKFDVHGSYPVFAALACVLSVKLAELSGRWIERPGKHFVMGWLPKKLKAT